MALTILIFLIYVCIEVFGIRYSGADENPTFFDIDYTTVMRGCCIIIVFVHIPSAYGDLVQDMVGSFGYICVTLFFYFQDMVYVGISKINKDIRTLFYTIGFLPYSSHI